jgi:hypothetical protein
MDPEGFNLWTSKIDMDMNWVKISGFGVLYNDH